MMESNRIYDQRAVVAVAHLDKVIRDIKDDEILNAGSVDRERFDFFDKIQREIEIVSSQITSLDLEYDYKCEDGELYGVLGDRYSRHLLIGNADYTDGTPMWSVIDRDEPYEVITWDTEELQSRRITPDMLFRIQYDYGVSYTKE